MLIKEIYQELVSIHKELQAIRESLEHETDVESIAHRIQESLQERI